MMETSVEYKGMPQKEFCKIWAADAEALLKAKENGKVLQIWKVNLIYNSGDNFLDIVYSSVFVK